MAAGVTISPDRLGAFRAYLEESLHDAVEKARQEDSLLIDGAVSAAGATVAMLTDIARAGPFGAGHAEPVFAVPAHTLAYARKSARRMCARACAQATARSSTRSRSVLPASRSAMR
jgi:single-stranded-DNA-specific exonuclease